MSDSFGGGSGTSSDPYVIRTPQQLYHLSKKVEGGTTYNGKYFVLANDIVLNDGVLTLRQPMLMYGCLLATHRVYGYI